MTENKFLAQCTTAYDGVIHSVTGNRPISRLLIKSLYMDSLYMDSLLICIILTYCEYLIHPFK